MKLHLLHILIQLEKFIEYLLCARHFSRHWGRVVTKRMLVLMELTFDWGKTKINEKIS